MAAFNKFQQFVQDLCEKRHDLSADALFVLLSNDAPSASLDGYKADLTSELGTGGGYTLNGADSTNTGAEASGTYTLTGTKIVWTGSGGGFGPFRYAVMYNDTQTLPSADGLVGWWDYGSSISVLAGETFSVKFNSSETTGTILTVA